MKATLQKQTIVEWGVANRPIGGETVSGDSHFVRVWPEGALAAVVDGLGHGLAAQAAAKTAISVFQTHPECSIVSLVRLCHQALARTRGAVLTVAALDGLENTLTWLGVGNVEGWLVRADPNEGPATESLLLRAGLVGYRLPVLRASVSPLARGDIVVLATDGVRPDFSNRIRPSASPQRIADQILAEHFKGSDDGLVLVARYCLNHG